MLNEIDQRYWILYNILETFFFVNYEIYLFKEYFVSFFQKKFFIFMKKLKKNISKHIFLYQIEKYKKWK